MKNYLLRSLVVMAVLVPQLAFGRPGRLTGRVTNDEGKPVALARVMLLGADSTLVKTELTNEKGEYTINATDGKYSIRVVMAGYDVYSSDAMTVASDNNSQD